MLKNQSNQQNSNEFDNNFLIDEENVQTKNLKLKTLKSGFLGFKDKTKKQKAIDIIFSMIAFLFLTACLIRVPYFGVFFDTIFFSFLSGWTKFLIYLWLFSLIILRFFNKTFLIVFNKNKCIGYFLLILSVSLIFSGIGAYVDKWQELNYQQIFWGLNDKSYINHWYQLMWTTDLLRFNLHNDYRQIIVPNLKGYGGLVSVFIIACFMWGSPAIIIIFAVITIILLITFLYFKFSNKPAWQNLKQKFLTFLSKKNHNSLIDKNEDFDFFDSNNLEQNLVDETKVVVQDEIDNKKINLYETLEPIEDFSNSKISVNDFNAKSGSEDNVQTLKFPETTVSLNAGTYNGVLVDKTSEVKETTSQFNLTDFNQTKSANHNGYLDVLRSLNHKSNYPLLSEITNQTTDNYDEYKSFSFHLLEKLETYFKMQKYDLIFQKNNINFQYTDIIFRNNEDNETTLEILNSENQIKNALNVDYLMISAIGKDQIIFKFKYQEIAKISIRDVLEEIGYQNPFCLGVGKKMDRSVVYIDTITNPNQIILGNKKPSGRIMQINQMILSAIFLNSYKNWNLYLFDTKRSLIENFKELKHTKTFINDSYDIIKQLTRINNDLETEARLFESRNVFDLYAYNSLVKQNEIIPNRLIVLNDLNEILEYDVLEANNLIISLLQKAKKHGLNLILTSEKITSSVIEFKNYVQTVISFGLNTPAESVNLLNSVEASKLFPMGDALMLVNNELIKIQCTYETKQETSKIIDLITKYSFE